MLHTWITAAEGSPSSADWVTYIITVGGPLGVFTVLFVTGLVYSYKTVADLRAQIADLKADLAEERRANREALAAERARSDAMNDAMKDKVIPLMSDFVSVSNKLLDRDHRGRT